MTKKYNYQTTKLTGDPLSATEWNNLTQDVETAIDAINEGTGGGSSSDSHIIFDEHSELNPNGKGNLTIQTTAEDQFLDNNKTKGGKINLEPINDLQIKAGDDISLYSHHREDPTEVSVKVLDGSDNPVKLLLNAANIVLTTKDKDKTKEKNANGEDIANNALYDDPTVMNITVNSAKNTKGYLKVRAQSIDLRCEDHGGIALQPKGYDNDTPTPHMNKIKFEHGGGDGLEFATFNSEKTSIYTDEYRFKIDGVWKMATRTVLDNNKNLTGTPGVTIGNGKYDPDKDDETKHYSYKKQSDDFYDVISSNAPTCTTEQIIKIASSVNMLEKDQMKLYINSSDAVFDFLPVTTFTKIAAEEIGTDIELMPNSVSQLRAVQELANEYNIVFVKIKGTNLRHYQLNGYADPYTYFEQDYRKDIWFLDRVLYTTDDTFNQSEPGALYKDIPTVLLLSTNTDIVDLPLDPDLWASYAQRAYLITKGFESEKNMDIHALDVNIHGIFGSVSASDIYKLVKYFKSGDGQLQGPWANL